MRKDLDYISMQKCTANETPSGNWDGLWQEHKEISFCGQKLSFDDKKRLLSLQELIGKNNPKAFQVEIAKKLAKEAWSKKQYLSDIPEKLRIKQKGA